MSFAFRLSIGANVVLMGIVAMLLWRDPSATPLPAVSPTHPPSAPSVVQTKNAVAQGRQADAVGTKPTPAAIAQLERMGVSRDVIVNALLGEFHRRWDGRFTELEKKYAPKQVPEWEYIRLARLRDAEQTQELKAALGKERYLAWDKERTLRMLNRGARR